MVIKIIFIALYSYNIFLTNQFFQKMGNAPKTLFFKSLKLNNNNNKKRLKTLLETAL
jgi:regulatory protein YycI of two-component signal transduction system YycFG